MRKRITRTNDLAKKEKGIYMGIRVVPSVPKELTRISCIACGKRVRGVGLAKDSIVSGLNFRCERCGKYCEVETDKITNDCESSKT